MSRAITGLCTAPPPPPPPRVPPQVSKRHGLDVSLMERLMKGAPYLPLPPTDVRRALGLGPEIQAASKWGVLCVVCVCCCYTADPVRPYVRKAKGL